MVFLKKFSGLFARLGEQGEARKQEVSGFGVVRARMTGGPAGSAAPAHVRAVSHDANSSGSENNPLEENIPAPEKEVIDKIRIESHAHFLHLRKEILGLPAGEKIVQYFFLGIAETGAPGGVGVVSQIAVLIVLGAFLRVRQNAVGFVYLLETFFGPGVPRISVRMRLEGKFPVSLLDIFG